MAEIIQLVIAIVAPLSLLALGFISGTLVERRHLRHLDAREDALRHLILTNTKFIHPGLNFTRGEMLAGEVVIGSDYFKNFLAGIRSFFGGEVRSLETLMERARREATLRVLEQAAANGAVAVFNLRLETSNIGATKGKKQATMGEILAYGTALYRA
jgi:uncharacterized protein YbjQ (UPF0145 family)